VRGGPRRRGRPRSHVLSDPAQSVPQGSALEALLALQIRACGLEPPVRQAQLIPSRRFRCDFAWEPERLIVEVEGGEWIRGAHVRPARFSRDCVKYAELAIRGWRLIRVTGSQVRSGQALRWIERALGSASGSPLPSRSRHPSERDAGSGERGSRALSPAP